MATGSPNNYFVHTLLRARDWQHRPQFDEVCEWWRGRGVGFQPADRENRKLEAYATRGRGVCALVGMGGAGKTAVAERFLRVLPGGLPVDPQVDKDPSLPTPHSTFVFSFYDAPGVDQFFESLQMWLEDTPRVETLLSVGQMLFMLQQRPHDLQKNRLVVLDGLERVQDDGRRGKFGRLHSPRLRDFLNQLASGNFSDLSVLVTSRFPLADLRDKNPRFFHPIPVNQIDIAAGVQLLKDRGVRGTDPQLEPIVQQCGRHALTVDFAGGYIAEYGQGNPATPLDLGTAEQLQAASEEDELDEDQREVLRQGYRFARIAEHYRDAMLQKDEAAMALLQRICLFRLGVDSETLAAIFTGRKAKAVAGKALARLNAKQLQTKLDWLTRMRIVEVSREALAAGEVSGTALAAGDSAGNATKNRRLAPCRSVYSIHPAVRDGFLSGISRDAALAGHEAVRKGLEVSLGDAPGENPSDPATLDLLEEIVHHTLQSGHVREAWDIYQNRIGAFENLGWRLGAYERGERICRAFAGGQSPETILPLALEGESRPDQAKRSSGSTASPQELMPELRRSAPRSGLPTTADDQRAAAGSHRYRDLPKNTQAELINGWGLYLKHLGRLADAARCQEFNINVRMQQEEWKHASAGNQTLCDVWLLSGRLSRLQKDEGGRLKDETNEPIPSSSFRVPPSEESTARSARLGASNDGALATADEALGLAELADDAKMRQSSYGYRGHARALLGEVSDALADFLAALEWQHTAEPNVPDQPLYSLRGIRHTEMLRQLGRHEEAKRLTEANKEILLANWGPDDNEIPKCQLVLSSLSIEHSGSPSSAAGSSADLWTQARDWALARDAKEVLCWSYLVEAQHALANHDRVPLALPVPNVKGQTDPESTGKASGTRDYLRAAQTALESGLKIARDCGYGLYHIDLLLERARLHLLRGHARAALDDIEVALGDEAGGGGIPANEETGQPELLAANHEACGYAWAIPTGLQLRAEALLLQAAREVVSVGWATPTKEGTLNPINIEAVGNAHPTIGQLIDDAKQFLHEALDRWHDLRDPEPTEDNNFVHPETSKEYNYKAEETYQVLVNLEAGILTRYPLSPNELEPADQEREPTTTEDDMSKRFNVALSFPGEHRAYVEEMANALARTLTKDKVFYDRFYEAELSRPNLDTYLQGIYHDDSELVVVALCKEYDEKEWCGLEFRAIRDLIKKRRDDEIMFVRLADGDVKGVFGIDGYVDAQNRPASEIAGIICDRLKLVQAANP